VVVLPPKNAVVGESVATPFANPTGGTALSLRLSFAHGLNPSVGELVHVALATKRSYADPPCALCCALTGPQIHNPAEIVRTTASKQRFCTAFISMNASIGRALKDQYLFMQAVLATEDVPANTPRRIAAT
jgi:hypothetical protein